MSNFNTLTDYDLTPNGHPDFSYDLVMGGVHVASVAQHLAGEEMASEIGWRLLLETAPIVIESKRCSTCGGEGGCPDCDPIVAAASTPVESDPGDGEDQEGDRDRGVEDWRKEVAALLYAPALAYSPAQIAQAHTDGTLIRMLCSLDRLELEAHAQALACYLIDAAGSTTYARLPEHRALILRRWRSMLATRPVGVDYVMLAQ